MIHKIDSSIFPGIMIMLFKRLKQLAYSVAFLAAASAAQAQATGPADLKASLTGSTDVALGAAHQYTVKVENIGGADGVINVVAFVLRVPTNMTWSALPSGCDAITGGIRCMLTATLGPSQSISTPFELTPVQAGSFSLDVQVIGLPNESIDNNSATLPITVVAPPAPAPDLISTLSGPVLTGGVQQFTLTVSNQGSAASTATQAWMTVPLDWRLITNASCPTGQSINGVSVLECAMGPLDPGASTTITFQVTPGTMFPTAQLTAGVRPPAGETVQDNNQAKLTLTATPAVPQAVPTLDWVALMALGLLLPWFARRQRQG